MQNSDSQRVREINKQLIGLYKQSDDPFLSADDEVEMQSQIFRLESELSQLESPQIQDNKLAQYIDILENSARTVQLYRQSLHDFGKKPSDQQTTDEIRQKNITLNKFRLAEKKMKSYRSKLTDLGLQPFEIDDIVLRGYREQNLRVFNSLVRKFENALMEYIFDYYDNNGLLPDEFLLETKRWLSSDKRSNLSSLQLQVHDTYRACLNKGIPLSEIETVIHKTVNWDATRQKQNLQRWEAELIAELGEDADFGLHVLKWVEQYDNQNQIMPQHVKIVREMKNLLLHGVSQQEINRVLKIVPKTNDGGGGIFSKFRNFRQDQ